MKEGFGEISGELEQIRNLGVEVSTPQPSGANAYAIL